MSRPKTPISLIPIFLDIHLTPYFPAKSFVIKLEGTKGDDENDWNSDYAQDA